MVKIFRDQNIILPFSFSKFTWSKQSDDESKKTRKEIIIMLIRIHFESRLTWKISFIYPIPINKPTICKTK